MVHKVQKMTGSNIFYVTSFIGALIAAVYTQIVQPLQSGNTELWFQIAERLGIPLVLFLGLLWLLYKIFAMLYPLFEEQIKKLFALPQEQLTAEREERIRQAEVYQDTIKSVVNSVEKLADKVDRLIDEIRREK